MRNEQCRKVPLISLLSINFRGGGVQISMLRKARRLMAMGFEVEVLVFERDGPLLDYYGDDIPVVELAPGSVLLGRWLAVQADPGGIRNYLRPYFWPIARPTGWASSQVLPAICVSIGRMPSLPQDPVRTC